LKLAGGADRRFWTGPSVLTSYEIVEQLVSLVVVVDKAAAAMPVVAMKSGWLKAMDRGIY
jgi:hypothetical protein